MVYTSEAVRHQGQPVHRAIVQRLRAAGLSGATTLLGIWGFHGDHAPHGDRLLQLGRHVPAVTIVVDTPGRIARGYSVIDELTRERGLVTCETVSCLDEAGPRPELRDLPTMERICPGHRAADRRSFWLQA
jgi:PII-like signaling protein